MKTRWRRERGGTIRHCDGRRDWAAGRPASRATVQGPPLSSAEGSGPLQGPPGWPGHLGGACRRGGPQGWARAAGSRPHATCCDAVAPTLATVPGSPRAPRACPGVSAGSWASPGPRVPPGRSLEGARRAAEGQPPSEWYRWHFHSVDGAGHPGVGKQRPLAAPAPQSEDVGKRRLL